MFLLANRWKQLSERTQSESIVMSNEIEILLKAHLSCKICNLISLSSGRVSLSADPESLNDEGSCQ